MRKTRTRRLASFIITVGIISVMFLGEVAAYSYSFYCNWSVYYTGTTTGSHLSETHTPPVHNHYRINVTSSGGSCQARVSFNGVVKLMDSGCYTAEYLGTTRPNISFQLQNYSSGSSASKGGTIEYSDY